jgi:hypothetical protein
MHRLLSIMFIGASLLFSTGSNATTYNLTTDWSTANNPNGVWSLRGDNTVLPTFFPNHLLDGNSGVWAPANTQGNFLPGFFKATDALFGWQIGDVVTHTPDQANGTTFITSNVLFTAPSAGLADISGVVWNARTSSPNRPQAWQLFVNGVLQLSGNLPGDGSNGRATPDVISLLDFALLAGDTVMLSMFRTGPGTSTGDYVGLNLAVDLDTSAVPLPAALPLFATVLAGGGLLAWRRKRKNAAALAAA